MHGDVSARRTSCRAGRAGLPRRRMRLVRRPRLRPRLLPQPPAAEMPVEARGAPTRYLDVLRRARRSLSAGVTWEHAGELEARAGAPAAGLLLARVDGKSPVEYSPTRRTATCVRADGAAAARASRSDRAGASRGRLGGAAGASTEGDMHAQTRSSRSTAAASGIRAAGRPSRPRSRSRAAPPAAPSRRPAPRPAPARRSTCATAAPRFGGLDVRRAVANVRELIAPCAASAATPRDQAAIDRTLDRARRHAEQGRASAATPRSRSRWPCCMPRPPPSSVPLWRYLARDGRGHACRCPRSRSSAAARTPARRVDVQDFMVVAPTRARFAEALDRTAEVYRAAGQLMAESGAAVQGVADEGGFWPAFDSNEEALEMLVRAIERAGFTPGDGRRHLARRRRLGVRPQRAATGWRSRRRELDARRHDRAARSAGSTLSDRLDRGPARRGRPGRASALSRRPFGEPHPDHRRRLPGHRRRRACAGRPRPAPATRC